MISFNILASTGFWINKPNKTFSMQPNSRNIVCQLYEDSQSFFETETLTWKDFPVFINPELPFNFMCSTIKYLSLMLSKMWSGSLTRNYFKTYCFPCIGTAKTFLYRARATAENLP
jgi:hypothetical protein